MLFVLRRHVEIGLHFSCVRNAFENYGYHNCLYFLICNRMQSDSLSFPIISNLLVMIWKFPDVISNLFSMTLPDATIRICVQEFSSRCIFLPAGIFTLAACIRFCCHNELNSLDVAQSLESDFAFNNSTTKQRKNE